MAVILILPVNTPRLKSPSPFAGGLQVATASTAVGISCAAETSLIWDCCPLYLSKVLRPKFPPPPKKNGVSALVVKRACCAPHRPLIVVGNRTGLGGGPTTIGKSVDRLTTWSAAQGPIEYQARIVKSDGGRGVALSTAPHVSETHCIGEGLRSVMRTQVMNTQPRIPNTASVWGGSSSRGSWLDKLPHFFCRLSATLEGEGTDADGFWKNEPTPAAGRGQARRVVASECYPALICPLPSRRGPVQGPNLQQGPLFLSAMPDCRELLDAECVSSLSAGRPLHSRMSMPFAEVKGCEYATSNQLY